MEVIPCVVRRVEWSRDSRVSVIIVVNLNQETCDNINTTLSLSVLAGWL